MIGPMAVGRGGAGVGQGGQRGGTAPRPGPQKQTSRILVRGCRRFDGGRIGEKGRCFIGVAGWDLAQ